MQCQVRAFWITDYSAQYREQKELSFSINIWCIVYMYYIMLIQSHSNMPLLQGNIFTFCSNFIIDHWHWMLHSQQLEMQWLYPQCEPASLRQIRWWDYTTTHIAMLQWFHQIGCNTYCTMRQLAPFLIFTASLAPHKLLMKGISYYEDKVGLQHPII